MLIGAGTETSENYQNAKIVFLNIENIHAVRDSYLRLVDAFYNFSIQFHVKIQEKGENLSLAGNIQ